MGLIVLLAAAGHASGENAVSNQVLPGITLFSETRTNPPTRLFGAEVDLTNPRVRLHVARGGADPDGPGPWQTTLMPPTEIASRENFDLVVNGDFFRARGIKDAEGTNSTYRRAVWSAVVGPAVSAGQIWSTTTNARPCLVVDRTGHASIRRVRQVEATEQEVVSGNVLLLRDGKVVPHESKVRHPRTVVGLNRNATKMVLLVVDGRKPGIAVGMNYEELAAELLRLGCTDALNLDGGGSSVLAVRDPRDHHFQILNEPTDGRERAVANVLGISVTP